MKMKARLSKLTAVIAAAAVTVGGVAPVSAWATDLNNAPTAEATVNENVVTATAHRAATPLPEILGANTPSGFGMINGSAPTADTAIGNFALEVWGTSNNVNPDPYWWNYYYNFNGGNSSNALLNIAAQGSPVAADTLTISDKYGGVSVSLYTRPDVLIGVSANNDVTDTSGYDSQLATIAATGEIYNPLKVCYNSNTLDTMIATVVDAASKITATGKETRYGSPSLIAADYANYIMGIKGYIKDAIGEENYKTIAIVSAVNDNGSYTIQGQGSTAATSTNRYVEYTEDVTNNLTSQATATATGAQLADVDAIIITSDAAENAILSDSTIPSGTNGPELISINEMETLYGVSMNSVENALGMGYILARIYDDSASVLNAKYVYEYFASKFYHIKSTSLDDIYEAAIADHVSDSEYEDLHVDDDAYNETALASLFAQYAQYY